jgi:hypothetical protein
MKSQFMNKALLFLVALLLGVLISQHSPIPSAQAAVPAGPTVSFSAGPNGLYFLNHTTGVLSFLPASGGDGMPKKLVTINAVP